MAGSNVLIGDLGGTHARFARSHDHGAGFDDPVTLECDAFDSPESAVEGGLAALGMAAPDTICLAVAGPVRDGRAGFLNRDWIIDAERISSRLGGCRVQLVHDFEAVAWALPALGPRHLVAVGPAGPTLSGNSDFTVAVLGPGTGLGVSGLLRRGATVVALRSEGGHLGFAPETEEQAAVLAALRSRFERVSDERLLSGSGLVNIHAALQEVHGAREPERDAAGIFELARNDPGSLAATAERLFFTVLGQVAGNLALTLGAQDGVFIGGGIVPRYRERLVSSDFRAGFENKGRHRELMKKIPTWLITHPHPGLLGAARLAHTADAQ